MIDDGAVLALIRAKVAQYKNMKQAAHALCIDQSYLSKVIRGARPPGLRLLKVIGLRRVVAYEPEP